jgi:hypothetical protein
LSAHWLALAVGAITFGAGMVGLYLQKKLPPEHMTGGSRDMILAVIGLVTLLLALVLGTLVGNTYAFYANQKSELETFASRALLFDQSLAEYGPEAKPIRDEFKTALTESYELFWKGASLDPSLLKVDVPIARYQPVFEQIKTLEAKTPQQIESVAGAKASLALMEQTRLLMSLQNASPIAWPLVVIVVAWAAFLFCGFGVLSGTNPTTIVALAAGAISVASAIYLILNLSQPYTGHFRLSPAALEQALEAIDK